MAPSDLSDLDKRFDRLEQELTALRNDHGGREEFLVALVNELGLVAKAVNNERDKTRFGERLSAIFDMAGFP